MRGFAALGGEFRAIRQERAAGFGELGVEVADERLRLLAERATQALHFSTADLARPMILQDRENPAEDQEEDDQPPFDDRVLRAGVHDWLAFTAGNHSRFRMSGSTEPDVS